MLNPQAERERPDLKMGLPGDFLFHDDSSTAFRWTTPKPDTAGLSIT
jgi:hypothetical protein